MNRPFEETEEEELCGRLYDIDIADILDHKYRYRIDIDNGDIILITTMWRYRPTSTEVPQSHCGPPVKCRCGAADV